MLLHDRKINLICRNTPGLESIDSIASFAIESIRSHRTNGWEKKYSKIYFGNISRVYFYALTPGLRRADFDCFKGFR